MAPPLVANLVCGSPWRNHDFDFARLRLGQAIYDLDNIRVDCYQDYEDGGGIANGDLLVSYTSQVPVTDKASTTLRRWLENGGRWFALHASNSVAGNQAMARIMGSRFISHPKYDRFRVQVTKADDPLLAGISDFDVPDELYCVENVTNDYEVLLHTHWGGEGFGNIHFEVEDRPMLYKRPIGEKGGGVLYLALGHANRPFDKPFPHFPDQPDYRGPWDMEIFQTLVTRGIEWGGASAAFLNRAIGVVRRALRGDRCAR